MRRLGAEESPLSVGGKLAINHASGVEMDHDLMCGDLFYVRLYDQLLGTDRLTFFLIFSASLGYAEISRRCREMFF